MNLQERMFEDACSVYAEHGVDAREALNKLAKIPIKPIRDYEKQELVLR